RVRRTRPRPCRPLQGDMDEPVQALALLGRAQFDQQGASALHQQRSGRVRPAQQYRRQRGFARIKPAGVFLEQDTRKGIDPYDLTPEWREIQVGLKDLSLG